SARRSSRGWNRSRCRKKTVRGRGPQRQRALSSQRNQLRRTNRPSRCLATKPRSTGMSRRRRRAIEFEPLDAEGAHARVTGHLDHSVLAGTGCWARRNTRRRAHLPAVPVERPAEFLSWLLLATPLNLLLVYVWCGFLLDRLRQRNVDDVLC